MTECYQNTIRRRRRFSQRNIVLLFVFLGVLLLFISVLPSRSLCKGNFRTVVRLHARLVRHCSDEVQGDTARCAQVCFGCEWFGKLKRGRDARDGVSSLPQGSRDLLALVVEVFGTEPLFITRPHRCTRYSTCIHLPSVACFLEMHQAACFAVCRVKSSESHNATRCDVTAPTSAWKRLYRTSFLQLNLHVRRVNYLWIHFYSSAYQLNVCKFFCVCLLYLIPSLSSRKLKFFLAWAMWPHSNHIWVSACSFFF